jgi:hypothetical protein
MAALSPSAGHWEGFGLDPRACVRDWGSDAGNSQSSGSTAIIAVAALSPDSRGRTSRLGPLEPTAEIQVRKILDTTRGRFSLDALPTPMPRRGLADWQVRRITAFMRGNLDRQVGLDELAALADARS